MRVLNVCHILNCNVWLQLTHSSSPEEVYSVEQAVLVKVFDQYKAMEVLKSYTEDGAHHSFLPVTCYAHKYFNTSSVTPIKFWSKTLPLQGEHIWKPTTLLVKIRFCISFSNASLENFSVRWILSKQPFEIVWQLKCSLTH